MKLFDNNNRQSILIDCSCLNGKHTGLETYALNLIEKLATENKIKIFILCSEVGKKQILKYPINLAHDQFIIANIKMYGLKREIFFLKLKLRNIQFDLYHCLHSYLPVIAPGNKNIVTVHDLKYVEYPDYLQSKLKSKILRRYINWSYIKSDVCICISRFTLEKLESYFGKKKYGESVVVYHGVGDFVSLHINEENNFANYILFVGENRPHKNLNSVIEAFHSLKNVLGEMDFVIVGQGYKREQFSKYKRIFCLNQVGRSRLIQLYKDANCLVFPSLYEGFGLPILEAMIMETPVVTSDQNSCSEVAGDHAFLVDPRSVESIATGIKMSVLCENKKLIKSARSHALSFTWEVCSKNHLVAYGVIKSRVRETVSSCE